MFDTLRNKLRRNSKVAEPVVAVNDIDLDFFYNTNPSSAWNGGNFARNTYESRIACDVRNCVRPSSYTVLTTAVVDVDIPGVYADKNFDRAKMKLPTFQEYHICDRCMRSDIDEVRSKAKFIAGPDRVYDPDSDEKTKRKLTHPRASHHLRKPKYKRVITDMSQHTEVS